MTAMVHGMGRLSTGAVALALVAAIFSGPPAMGFDDGPQVPARKGHKWDKLFHKKVANQGTLGYGPPGLHPGFQGFGLGYHPGYGYGGDGLGVGALGGYPFYGGPGYPHPAPCLNRLGPITPFAYFGGPGGPSPDHPHFFGEPGPLAPDRPVVTFEGQSPESGYGGGYGVFDGMIPYPESTFASSASMESDPASSDNKPNPPSDDRPNPPSPPGPTAEAPRPPRDPETSDAGATLGLETEPVADSGLAKGLKVTRLVPGGLAEKSGIQVGDVIRAANGYLTEQPGNLTWILGRTGADNLLKMNIRSAKDGEVRILSVLIP